MAYVIDKQCGICTRYPLLKGLCVPSVKTLSNKFNASFCTKDQKIHQTISNLNRKF